MSMGITSEKMTEAEALLNECYNCINEGNVDNFASYEDGVKDTLNWLLYGDEKPIIGRET